MQFSQASHHRISTNEVPRDTWTLPLRPTDPTVMTQQIQALTANVQELMKQNEELKRKARPETLTMSQSWRNRNDNEV